MRSHLNGVAGWSSLARKARYRACRLAALVNCSPRELERFCRQRFGRCPHRLLEGLRFREAVRLLRAGWQIKRISVELGFSRPSHFCESFRHHCGKSPLEFLRNAPNTRSRAGADSR